MIRRDSNSVKQPPSLLHSVWLARRVGSAPGAYAALISRFADADGVYAADFSGAEPDRVIRAALLRELCDKSLDTERGILDYCAKHRITVLTPNSAEYPSLLRDIPDPPAALYLLGRMPDFSHIPATAVVGTRKMTRYGMLRAYDLGYGLARGGSAVVSGMAAGGDGMALAGALDAGGIPVAVLGCGVDRAYPQKHAALMEEIEVRGAVISEYPPGTEVRAQNFPERNRIISGLCRAVCVTEAAEHSGALITARLAEKQARALYAVPGDIGSPGSEGVNSLLRAGASPVLTADDVLRSYIFLYPDRVFTGRAGPQTEENARRAAAAHRLDLGTLEKHKDREPGRDARITVATDVPAENARIKLRKSDINTTVRQEEPKEAQKADPKRVRETLSRLDEKTVWIYGALPEGCFTPDEAVNGGIPIGDLMCALTVLEVNGLIRALPAGRFEKC